MEDLELAYQAFQTNTPHLPPKTTSYKQWATLKDMPSLPKLLGRTGLLVGF